MKFRFLALLPLLSVVACNVQAPIEITSEPATVSLVRGAPIDRIRGKTTKTTIRAYQAAQTESGKATTVEITGARCKLTSDHIRGEITTPATVLLPKYDQDGKLENRGVPPSILVECTADKRKGQALLAAKPGQISTGGSGNLVVDLVVLAGTAAVAAEADWRYEPAIRVNVE